MEETSEENIKGGGGSWFGLVLQYSVDTVQWYSDHFAFDKG